MDNKNEFKPYIPADKVTPEITVTSLIVGVILAVVFGAANAYLGLRVGMTVSASIPAAVLAMGIIRIIMKKNSILESNMVQTIGSAGESLAAGAIFTLPTLFLWAAEGKMDKPGLLGITLVSLFGGLLGVFFMIPLRNALIVKEHGVLPYPEGLACAEVLEAGENGGAKASTVFSGMGFAAAFKFLIDGLKLVPSQINMKFKGYAGEIGTQIYPAVMSVGYICGPRIASYMFSGGFLSWMVIIPIIVLFGADTVISPGTAPIGELFANGGAGAIWGSYIRYIGAGALIAGGVISLIKSLPLISSTFKDAVKSFSKKNSPVTNTTIRTNRDMSMKVVFIAVIALIILIAVLPIIPVKIPGAILVVVLGFFVATISSRMVGLVGSSNNPVSGMTIAAVLVIALVLTALGGTGVSTMAATIEIGSIICIIATISGDTSQDLKTGYILGATPKKQQIGEIIGVVASSIAIGGTLYILDAAWSFGTEELPAAQATLMKMITEGVIGGDLPWGLILIGVCIAIIAEILKIPVLPFAVGIYLPIQLNACIMVGGVIRLVFEKLKKKEEEKKNIINNGVLFCSGMIAGEGIVGILLAILAVFGVSEAIDLSGKLNLSPVAGTIGSIVMFGLIIFTLLKFSLWKKQKKNEEKQA